MLAVSAEFDRGSVEMRYDFRTETIVTGVFGRSGAGKSTLLHLVSGLVAPTAGTIRLENEVLFDSAKRVDRPAHRRAIGIVFQEDRLFPHLSVRGNLRYGARRGGGKQVIGFDDAVELLELGSLLDRRVRDLSGGEARRVSLGRALLSSPRLLLLDEPLSFLDREQRQRILGLIRRVRDQLEIPMLYVSHDLGELLQLTDRLLVIDRGRTVGHGPLREVVRNPSTWTAVRGLGPLNVLSLTVAAHDDDAGLTSLRAGAKAAGPTLVAPLRDRAQGAAVSVSVRPEDIALSIEPIRGISIQNQVPGRIVRVTAHTDRAVVEIDTAFGPPLLVEVSHRTVSQMALAPGGEVRCLIKSNAIQYID